MKTLSFLLSSIFLLIAHTSLDAATVTIGDDLINRTVDDTASGSMFILTDLLAQIPLFGLGAQKPRLLQVIQ